MQQECIIMYPQAYELTPANGECSKIALDLGFKVAIRPKVTAKVLPVAGKDRLESQTSSSPGHGVAVEEF